MIDHAAVVDEGGASRTRNHPVIFDFDDTLIISRSDRADLLVAAVGSFGVANSPEKLSSLWGKPFRELVTGIAPEVGPRFDEFIAYYVSLLRSRPAHACVGVAEALPDLARRHRLFVHSSSYSALVRVDLESLGLLGLFEFVCGSDWQSTAKPDPESLAVIRRMLDVADVAPESAWYVGDSIYDYRLATAAGLEFAGVAYNEASWSAFIRMGVRPGRIVRSMTELKHLLHAD